MKIIYKLTQNDIKQILKEYIKENYNLCNPYIRIKKELQDDYFNENHKIESIVAQIFEM